MLQWGRTLSSAESAEGISEAQAAKELQWGRTLSSAESENGRKIVEERAMASMGPHSFKCGKGISCATSSRRKSASMGPHSFKCGKVDWLFYTPLASLFASMGPHSFKCGKARRVLACRRRGAPLQWGRTLSSAESPPKDPSKLEAFELQWGRTLSSAESRHPPRRKRQAGNRFNGAALFQVRKETNSAFGSDKEAMLQWGRTLSSAESALYVLPLLIDADASMGPHSFKCGKS